MALTESLNELIGMKPEIVIKFKYLEIRVDRRDKGKTEKEQKITKTLTVHHTISKKFLNTRHLPAASKIKIYEQIYRPEFTYGCEAW